MRVDVENQKLPKIPSLRRGATVDMLEKTSLCPRLWCNSFAGQENARGRKEKGARATLADLSEGGLTEADRSRASRGPWSGCQLLLSPTSHRPDQRRVLPKRGTCLAAVASARISADAREGAQISRTAICNEVH